MVNNSTILNPDTPLAFLPPPLANRFQNARYPVISSLTVSTISCLPTHCRRNALALPLFLDLCVGLVTLYPRRI